MADERDPLLPDPVRTLQRRVEQVPQVPIAARRAAVSGYKQAGRAPAPRATDARHILVRQVMRHPVPTLPVSATLGEAFDLMAAHKMDLVPLTEEEQLSGVVSRGDLAKMLVRGEPNWRALPLVEVMTREVVAVAAARTLHEAATLMIDSGHLALPVVQAPLRPVGLLSSAEILKMLIHKAPLQLWA